MEGLGAFRVKPKILKKFEVQGLENHPPCLQSRLYEAEQAALGN